jgi:tripartite-type tricarboxylate transporter receptor subunit TctC
MKRASNLQRRHLLQLAMIGATACAAMPMAAHADAWPTKPITLVVPFPPGGPTDMVARVLAQNVGEQLGQSVIVDNKPGANGNIGNAFVAKAAADGYTVLYNTSSIALSPALYKKLSYNVNTELAPVALTAVVPLALVVNPKTPVNSVAEFVKYAKDQKGKLSYGSAGNGSAGHLAFEYLKMTAEIFMLHVPYRGTGPMMTDLLSGRLDAASVGAAALLPFIKSGKVRCIATGSTQRLPQLPDVPTVAEQGFPGFEMTQWYGMLAPASLPKEHLDKLAAETMKAVKAPEALKRLNGDAAEAIGGTPAQFAQFIAAEQARWQKVIKRAQIKPD